MPLEITNAFLDKMPPEVHRYVETIKQDRLHWMKLKGKADHRADLAERQVRDLAHEITVLKAKIKRLESEGE
jgi:hypothetical protein